MRKFPTITKLSIRQCIVIRNWRPFPEKFFQQLQIESDVVFDCRAFVVPKEDVNNVLLWRQQDATRNSVQMLARSLYSHKECNNKNNSELQEMCFQKGQNWNDVPTSQKRGRCIVKRESLKIAVGPRVQDNEMTVRKSWEVDNEIPVFSQDRDFIGKLVQ